MPQKLVSLSVKAPGFYGLNSQRKGDILPMQWATRAENFVFDDSGRMASRKGYQHVNASAIGSTPDVKVIHEYVAGANDTLIILAAGNAIYKVVGDTLTDISGTITTPTADNWKFVNFNGKCVGFQNNHSPIVLSSTSGSFADISIASGTATSNEVLAAFGRLWIIDGNSLKYSALLDETHWSTGAGSFDLSSVWTNGMDEGIALAEFNGYLIVFGKYSIAVWNNPWVPTGTGATDISNNMSLVENIAGVGCIARDSIQHVGKDIVFLSAQGVRSLGRVIQEKSMPIQDISKNVQDDFNSLVAAETDADIKSAYSKKDGFYIITLPSQTTTYYFDLNRQIEDGSFRTTTWALGATALMDSRDGDLYIAVTSGYISKYTGYMDAVSSDGTGGSSYEAIYRTGWNDFGQYEGVDTLVKIPKKFSVLLQAQGGQSHDMKWAFDFDNTFNTATLTAPVTGKSLWGVAEWGIGEWSGGTVYAWLRAPMSKTGQTIKLGLDLTINGSRAAIQQADIVSKIGRMAA